MIRESITLELEQKKIGDCLKNNLQVNLRNVIFI